MFEVTDDERRLTLKLVYYGPGLSGKTTNLLCLHDALDPERRGDLVTLDTYQDRTLFFDLLPFFVRAPSGLGIKVKVYTVPGQVRYDATRKAVLSRADGVVFVADSQRSEQRNNAESFANLETNCRVLGMDLRKMPLVVQFNKRDLEDVIGEDDARERWASVGVPLVFATALHGVGVCETFDEVLRRAYRLCDETMKLSDRHGLPEEAFVNELGFVHG